MSEVDPLDLSNLQMLPDWVKQPQEKPKFKEESVRPPGGKGKPMGKGGGFGKGGYGAGAPAQGRRDDRRGDNRGRGGGGGGGGGGGAGGGGRRTDNRDNNQRRPGKGGDNRDRRGGPGGQRRDNRDARPQQEPLPKDVTLFFQPAREGVAFIAQQIKMSGCSYPVFDLARLILNNRDRYSLIFESKGNTKLYVCKLDQSLWLNSEEALAHATTCKEFGDYYREEKVTVDPPKGNFTSIAVCGLSGKLLGPPNHHSYQENIIRIHAERFSRMHIDGYKRKIKIERDEEIVEKWKEQESSQSHFTFLKAEEGAEPVVLKSRQEAIRHFSQNFAATLIQEVQKATLPGDVNSRQLARPLFNLLRQEGDRLRKFPMDLVQRLCRAFEKQGLKFFKEGKKTTYVARLRPRLIPNEENFSDGIRKIVSYVRAHPNTKLNDLAGALIPESKRSSPPKPKPQPPKAKEPKPEGPKPEEPKSEEPKSEEPKPEEPKPEEPKSEEPKSEEPKSEEPKSEEPKSEEPKSEEPKPEEPKRPAAPALTPEEIAVLQDLRWLIHEGYVIEFSNGTLKLPRAHEQPNKRAPRKKVAAPPKKSAPISVPGAVDDTAQKPDPTPTSPPPSASAPLSANSPATPPPDSQPPAIAETVPHPTPDPKPEESPPETRE